MYTSENEIEEMYLKYQHLIRATLKRQYPNYHDFAKSHGLDIDDLLQLGGIGLHKAIKDYNPLFNTSFKTHAINQISYALMTEAKMYSIRNENNRSFKLSGDCSFETPRNDGNGELVTLHDVLEEKVDFIQDVEFDIILDNIAKEVSPNLATAVRMRYENYTLKQIGEQLDMSAQGVNQMLKNNQDKLVLLMLA